MPREPLSAEQVFSAARKRILTLHPDDEEGRMLKSAGLKTGGRFYAFATPADVVVKLPAERVAEMIGAGLGNPCETQPGRPMREWVRIPTPDADDCLAYLREAREFVAGLGAGAA